MPGPCRSLDTHWRSARVVLTFSAAERAAIPSSPMAFSCKLRHASAASARGPGTQEQGEGQRAQGTVCQAFPNGLGGPPGHHALTASPARDMRWGHRMDWSAWRRQQAKLPPLEQREGRVLGQVPVGRRCPGPACPCPHLLEAGQAAVGL